MSDAALYDDWAASHDFDGTVTAERLIQFVTECPASPGTLLRRLKAIAYAHNAPKAVSAALSELYGHSEAPRWPVEAVRDAISSCPQTRFPVGLAGRRDAFVLLLFGELRLSRSQIHSLRPAHVNLRAWTIAGQSLEYADDPRRCPRCVLVRWLSVLRDHHVGGRALVRTTLYLAATDDHDCSRTGLELTTPLIPGIDKHGWLDTSQNISPRSITSIVSSRRAAAGQSVEEWVPKVRLIEPVSKEELADAFDDLNEQLDALERHTQELLDSAQADMDFIKRFS